MVLCDKRGQNVTQTRVFKGALSYRKGFNAEQLAAQSYERRGATVLESRWRGTRGEIDLILQHHGTLIFCEVKASSSRDNAINSLSPKQMRRIQETASEFLGQTEDGQLSDMRFDLAIVDGQGRVDVIENAFGHF